MSEYFLRSKYADHHIETIYKTIEKHMAHCHKHIPIIGGGFNAELEFGKGTERKSVGRYALNKGNKKRWLDEKLTDATWLLRPLAMFRRTPQKRTTFVAPKGKEKQIDYILTKRIYLRHAKDSEANDMVHLRIDHRCVMAIFMITMFGKNIHIKDKKKQDMIDYDERDQAEKHQYWKNRARKKIPIKRWH